MLQVENELNQYGDTPWTPRGWGVIPPWPVTADDSSDVFNVSFSYDFYDASIALK